MLHGREPTGVIVDTPRALRCPRCARGASRKLGADWCCWELKLLEDLMAQPEPPTMRELTAVHFIGRSEKSIDNACRRYGFKTPARSPRRRRCSTCCSMFEGAACGVCDISARAA